MNKDHIIYIRHTNDSRIIESCEDYFIVQDIHTVETKVGREGSNKKWDSWGREIKS